MTKSWLGYFIFILFSFFKCWEKKVNWFYFFIPDGFLGFSLGVMLCNFSSKSTPISFQLGQIYQILWFFWGELFLPSFFEIFRDSFVAFFGMRFSFHKKIIYCNSISSSFFLAKSLKEKMLIGITFDFRGIDKPQRCGCQFFSLFLVGIFFFKFPLQSLGFAETQRF